MNKRERAAWLKNQKRLEQRWRADRDQVERLNNLLKQVGGSGDADAFGICDLPFRLSRKDLALIIEALALRQGKEQP